MVISIHAALPFVNMVVWFLLVLVLLLLLYKALYLMFRCMQFLYSLMYTKLLYIIVTTDPMIFMRSINKSKGIIHMLHSSIHLLKTYKHLKANQPGIQYDGCTHN